MDKAAIGRDEAIDLVRQYKLVISKHFAVEPQVMLFGSYSKGTANRDSDIDVAVIVPSYGDRKLEISKALWRDVDDVSLLIEPVLISREHPCNRFHLSDFFPLYTPLHPLGIGLLLAVGHIARKGTRVVHQIRFLCNGIIAAFQRSGILQQA